VKILLRAASVVLLASASMACFGVHARTQPEGPSLDVPPPPPLVGAPIESAPEPAKGQRPPAAVGVPPPKDTSAAPPRKPQPARLVDQPDKTEPPPAAPAKPATEAAPPAASLQTTAKVGELEKKIQALLKRATQDLDKIVVGTLGADRRAQYDEARRFAEQAEAALKVKNLPFAEQLADKAATLADLLAKK
jgi:CRISPR-associated Cas5-like protein